MFFQTMNNGLYFISSVGPEIEGYSFGCAASGVHILSAPRDEDLQEAKALLEDNLLQGIPLLVFGILWCINRHLKVIMIHEIIVLLLESGLDVNLRNYSGQHKRMPINIQSLIA